MMGQLEAELRRLIKEKILKETSYVPMEEIEKLIDFEIDQIAKKIFERHYE